MNNVKKSAIFSGLVYAAFMGCYYGFTENLRTAIILTVLNWLFFTLFMYLLGNSKYMKKITAMDFGNGAPMIISSGANHFSGRIAVGGRLFLFNDMLQFKPHKFNFYRNETQIALRDVNAVEFYDILGLFRTGMKITAVNGNVEKFVVENREIWKSKILEAQKQSA